MTRQNRVMPTGEIVALPFRGAWMGNRGILHDDGGRLGRARWRHRHWITCRLAFKGRRRPIMAPHRYSELFFFDEAVALAAGHRPCAECRRADYERFRDAWVGAFGGARPSADAMDRVLHEARIAPGGKTQRRSAGRLADLPDGVFVLGTDGQPALVEKRGLRPYRLDRYATPHAVAPETCLTILTPVPILAVLSAGYAPTIVPQA